MNLLVTTEAQHYIFLKGGNARAKLEHPSLQLGRPKESEVKEYKEVQLNDHVKIYVHLSLLSLDDSYQLKIDLKRGLLGKRLVLTGI
ncbi:hypothetical protein [Desulfitobacterium sp.]|uniref:hypothetical protein n=1 Tax=Desulfitobacterium sp. TaxID=49981 RepID=UPI002CE0F948|nr:hypothetical protein [Desulfitobacterium sp.]HVJ49162.1 hypothetical protein [Desulfitobacterium sp.]